MNKKIVINVVLGIFMVVSAVIAKILTPTIYLSKTRPVLMLNTVIPVQFGDWKEEKNMVATVINPETAAVLKKIYSQTLSRTYVNSSGQRIMLSIAYGGDQSDTVQIHYPEICYPAQGFMLVSNRTGVLHTAQGAIPVKRLETNLSNQRFEPITYWTTVGDQVVTGGVNKKLAEMRYALDGQIPDGLLFRVSSIDKNSDRAYALHESFVGVLEQTLDIPNRKRLMGLSR